MTTLQAIIVLTIIILFQTIVYAYSIDKALNPVQHYLKQVIEEYRFQQICLRAMTLTMQRNAALKNEDYHKIVEIDAELSDIENQINELRNAPNKK